MATTRVKPNQLYDRLFWRQYNTGTGSWTAWNVAATLNRVGDVTIVTGDNIPNWRERIKLKQSATTLLTVNGYKMSRTLPIGDCRIHRIYKPTGALSGMTQTMGHLGMYVNTPGLPTLSATRANNAALTHFIKKATAAQRSLSGGVVLGEFREVVRMIRRPTVLLRRGMVDYLRDVSRRLKQRRGLKSLKSKKARLHAVNRVISSTWLEYQFGWKPLVSDIESGLIAAYRIANEDRPSKVVSAFSHEEVTGNRASASYGVGYGTLTTWTTEYDMVDVRYKGCVYLQSGLTGATRMLGLSWRDVVPTIWELIPYSFLVDYFSNIGDVIEALSFNKADIAWMEKGQYLRRVKVNTETTLQVATPPTNYEYILDSYSAPGKYEIERFSKSRTQYTGSIIPSLEFQIPGAKSLKWLNITALLAQGRSSQKRLRSELRI
jgi:hypothetical protein